MATANPGLGASAGQWLSSLCWTPRSPGRPGARSKGCAPPPSRPSAASARYAARPDLGRRSCAPAGRLARSPVKRTGASKQQQGEKRDMTTCLRDLVLSVASPGSRPDEHASLASHKGHARSER